MNTIVTPLPAILAVSFAAGSVVVGVVVAAIAVLVLVLWRRSAGSAEVPRAVEAPPRRDSRAVGASSTVFEPQAQPGSDPAAESSPRRDRGGAPRRPHAASGPHPSGLGAAELAAIVEDGLSSLALDLDRLGELIDSVGAASAVPDDLPARPASEQVALVDRMTATIDTDLDEARRLADAVATDVERGHEACAVVHGELVRIGLPAGFFVAMDTTAADVAVGLVRARMAVERLVRRFEALSSLYSSVRPTLERLADLEDVLARAAATADPWRRKQEAVDLVGQRQGSIEALPR